MRNIVLGEGLSEESTGYEYRPRSPFDDSHPFSTLKFFFLPDKTGRFVQ
jgi:hypothetical protein